MQYLLLSTICISLAYISYRLVFPNETNFKLLRSYLLASILLSLFIPLINYQIRIPVNNKVIYNKEIAETQPVSEGIISTAPDIDNTAGTLEATTIKSTIPWKSILLYAYLIAVTVLLLRIFYQVLKLLICYMKSEKKLHANFRLIYNSHFKNTFSFFNWIFINKEKSSSEDIHDIITHEEIHVHQYHSFDILLMELLSAVMWFNPLVWMMRNTVQLVHEYLADEGALNTGIDRLRYQALLINQITEERLICLSSGFNHSLIKKRMIMMTKQKFNQRIKLKILVLIPLAALLFLGVACVKGQNNNKDVPSEGDVIAAFESELLNVLYLGIENPVKIAVSGYKDSEIVVSTSNGRISKADTPGTYLVVPAQADTLTLFINCNGKIIQQKHFRVKYVPDPHAEVEINESGVTRYVKDGQISKEDLPDAVGLRAILGDGYLDLKFRVISFVVSATVPNSTTNREEISNSWKFSESQIELLKSLIENQKLIIEEIIVVGPDGAKRKLSPMVFTITK